MTGHTSKTTTQVPFSNSFQFGLKELLVVVAAACLFCGMLAGYRQYQQSRSRQRFDAQADWPGALVKPAPVSASPPEAAFEGSEA